MQSCAHPNHLIYVTELFIAQVVDNLTDEFKKGSKPFMKALDKQKSRLNKLKALGIENVGKEGGVELKNYMDDKDKKRYNIVGDVTRALALL